MPMVTDFKKKQQGRRVVVRLALIIGVAALGLLGCALAVADVHVYQKQQRLNSQVSGIDRQIQQLETSNRQLQQSIQNQGNSQYVEQAAREQLDMQQPGETAVSFAAQPASAAAAAGIPHVSWLQTVWNWIKNKL